MKLYNEIYTAFSNSFLQLEKKRKRSILLAAIGWILFMLFVLAITIFVILSFTNSQQSSSTWISFITWLMDALPKGFPPQIIIIGGFVALSYGTSLLLKKGINAESNFKLKTKKLLKSIATTALPNFSFDRKIRVQKEEVRNSKLFNYLNTDNNINEIIINDSLSHQYEHTLLKICDLQVHGSTRKQATSFLMNLPFFNQIIISYKLIKSLVKKKDMIDSLQNESFRGVFAVADFNKNLVGHTIILPDNLEKKLGGFAQAIQKLNVRKEELIKLEDVAFEKEFMVFSTDQVEARYALTPSMMEKLTSLKQKIDKPIMVSFNGKQVSIAIQNTGGFFGIEKSKKMDDKLLKETYEQLISISSIVEELNLNNNLWKR